MSCYNDGIFWCAAFAVCVLIIFQTAAVVNMNLGLCYSWVSVITITLSSLPPSPNASWSFALLPAKPIKKSFITACNQLETGCWCLPRHLCVCVLGFFCFWDSKRLQIKHALSLNRDIWCFVEDVMLHPDPRSNRYTSEWRCNGNLLHNPAAHVDRALNLKKQKSWLTPSGQQVIKKPPPSVLLGSC